MMQLNTAHKMTRKQIKAAGMSIRGGVGVQLIQPRIPRELHRLMKAEAKAAKLALTRWILETCKEAIERKQKTAKN